MTDAGDTVAAVRASAPGKVVICGEYAVLEGAPAIAMAVNRRAAVKLAPAGSTVSTVGAPGYTTGPSRFEARAGAIRWLEGEAIPLLEETWRAAGIEASPALDIELDTRAFTDAGSGLKIGIGSSAALTVALTAGLAAALGGARLRSDPVATAFAAHRALQHGAGSGVDVAAALTGGLLQFYRPGERRRPLAWPAGVHFALFWSGTPASTVERIRRFRDAAGDDAREELGAAAERAAAAWSQGDLPGIFVETRRFRDALHRYDEARELGIFTAGHAELAAAAPDGVLYKPCGAGGGDVGMALSMDTEALAGFAALAADRGFRRVPVELDARGVEVRQGHA